MLKYESIAKEEIMNKTSKKGVYEKFFKRFFDILLSLLALVVLSPFLLIIVIILKITLKKDIIIKQYRPGKNGKIFKLYKFRSMTNAVDENGKLLEDSKRVTKFGRFMRKTGIDELPQLVNIIKGDMSIVGPRARLIKDMIFFDDNTLKAYGVRPGLTGLGQVSGGRSTASWEEIFELDKKYSDNITLWNDIKIIFKTVGVVLGFKSDAGCAGESKREYYYSDYLLHKGDITEEEYNKGLKRAEEIIENKEDVVKNTAEYERLDDEDED